MSANSAVVRGKFMSDNSNQLIVDKTYDELEKISQFGSDFYPHIYGMCAHPFKRPEPYNNVVIGLTADERVRVAEFVYELRGGMECHQKH